MGAGRGRSLCALWGGISLGVGTLAFALFSPSSVGCSTNLVVLTHSSVTARGCAAYSVIAHIGVGLIVLGAVLLLGSFALAVRSRRHAATTVEAPGAPPVGGTGPTRAAASVEPPAVTAPPPAPPARTAAPAPPVTEPVVAEAPVLAGPWPPEPQQEPAVAWSRPIAPGEDVLTQGGPADESAGLLASAVRLPPGWYGNPNNPGGPVQWWDGTKLTDGPA